MTALNHIAFFISSLGLLVAVPAASGNQAGASPSPSPVGTSTAVSTYSRTYGRGAPSPAATPVVYHRGPIAPPVAPPPALTSIAPTSPVTPAVQLVISVADQKLAVVVNGKVYRDYRISTSRYGEGDNWGSWRTPTGMLEIAGKIGNMAPAGAVFFRRQVTGEVLAANAPGRDPIVSRIIWLRGMEIGNRNAYKRCIYIHGTPQEAFLGRKASFGCIRMRSVDVIQVYDWVNIGTPVTILEEPLPRAIKDADRETSVLLAQNTRGPLRNSPMAIRNEAAVVRAEQSPQAPAKNEPSQALKPPPTIAAKVTDYRIPAPTVQVERVGPPDPQVLTARKSATAAN